MASSDNPPGAITKADGPAKDKQNEVVVRNEKPLNQTALKNLEKIVMGDFEDLTSEVRRHIDNRKAERLREVDAKFGDDRRLAAARVRVTEVLRALEDQARVVMDELGQDNIKPKNGAFSVFNLRVSPNELELHGHQEARRRIDSAASRLRSLADSSIAKSRRLAQRQILLQGVTGMAASELLNDLPGYQDVLEQVFDSMSEDGGEDIKELMGDVPLAMPPSEDEHDDVVDAEVVE